MHELSIARSLIAAACDAAASNHAGRILKVRARIGRLSGVAGRSLQSAFPIAAEKTPCEGAQLEIETSPVVIYCNHCRTSQQLSDPTPLECPVCGQPAATLLGGQELELVSLEVEDREAARAGSSAEDSQEG